MDSVGFMKSWDVTNLDLEVHKPQVLLSEQGVARSIAINLPGGDRLQEHEVHEHTYLVLISGELEIADADKGSFTATPGYVVHWVPGERREVRANQDSRFLLFLAPWPGQGHPGSRG
jgi:quercetin dioxygenase-like cupin family protein